MLICPRNVAASTLAFYSYQSISKCGFSRRTITLPKHFQSTPSALFASDESFGERNINFLTNNKDHNNDVTSINRFNSRAPGLRKSWTNIGRLIATCLGRSRRGIPRTTNISQHAINSLARLGRECCFASAFLLMFHRISTSSQPLCRFMTTNLTRWIAVSFVMKLLNLQSQITALNQSTTNIDDDWFLKGKYYVKPLGTIKKIRQVPSDGSCLFHAIGASLLHEEMKQQSQMMEETDFTQHHPSLSRVVEYSPKLRERAVNALESNPEKFFVINQDEEPTTASSLVELASQQYGITSEEYLTSMREDSVWGGGPEIIALASELKRQIVVLEPTSEDAGNDVHTLQTRARFGEAVSCDDDGTAIYILCADQNYPDGCGRKGGNHFFAVFPSKTS